VTITTASYVRDFCTVIWLELRQTQFTRACPHNNLVNLYAWFNIAYEQ